MTIDVKQTSPRVLAALVAGSPHLNPADCNSR